MNLVKTTEVLILGAGGAGMMCAIEAARRGRRVVLLDHANRLGGKILISGGGRCNFTNTGATFKNYVSENPHFCKSALSRFTPQHFIELVEKHGIQYHEKKLGQLFCDDSARQIVEMLKAECEASGARFELGVSIKNVSRVETSSGPRYQVEAQTGDGSTVMFEGESLVVATGGLSIPKVGATGLGYEIAEKFGLKLTERMPALDGFTFTDIAGTSLTTLAGVSVDCEMTCNDVSFRENILFTHSGISGPAALQASLHWRWGDSIFINLLPELNLMEWLIEQKRSGNRSIFKNLLAQVLPARLSELLCELYWPKSQAAIPLPQVSERELQKVCDLIHAWELRPSGTVGYSKAEVTRGGVDTNELSSKTMESKKIPGLYFIGEVVDVTGWLGGYNFQWAWASGWSAGQVV